MAHVFFAFALTLGMTVGPVRAESQSERTKEDGIMTVLRTPEERFKSITDFPYEPRYVEVKGVRMAYVDVGEGDPILCLHGEPSWGYLYRKMIPKGNRVVVPDQIGFGRSDKLGEKSHYTYAMFAETMTAFIEALDLTRITLVCQDWGGLIGLPIAAERLGTAELGGAVAKLLLVVDACLTKHLIAAIL